MKRFVAFGMLAALLGSMLLLQQGATASLPCDGSVAGYEVIQATGDGPVTGGAGNQVLLGTPGDDVLRGGSGHDILCGFGGNDSLIGGSGNDIIVGGDGADDLRGNSGNDTFYSDVDDIRVRGGSGNDRTIPVVPTATATNTATATATSTATATNTATATSTATATATATATNTSGGPAVTLTYGGFIVAENKCHFKIAITGIPAGTQGLLVIQQEGMGTISFADITLDSSNTYSFDANIDETYRAQFDYNDPGLETISSGFLTCSSPGSSTSTATSTATATATATSTATATATATSGSGDDQPAPAIIVQQDGNCRLKVFISNFASNTQYTINLSGFLAFMITTDENGSGVSNSIDVLNEGDYTATVEGTSVSDEAFIGCLNLG